MKYIEKVIQNGEDIQLLVHCRFCNRTTVLIDDEHTFCNHCGNEIEDTCINAWEEYYNLKPSPDIFI